MDSTLGLLLPTNTTHTSLLRAMNDGGVFTSEWQKLVITLPGDCFITASGLAQLAAWGVLQCKNGRKIEFYGDIGTRNYLARMDLFRLLGFDFNEEFDRHTEAGRFMPVHSIQDENAVFETTNTICDLVLHQFENAREFLPAMEWCVNEIIDNVRLHAEAPTPGIVCAQFYPTIYRLDVAIVDQGRGIKKSLSERLSLSSHRAAILRALERGMTRNPNVGQGNGLAGTLDIVRCNGGDMDIWTGDSDFIVRHGKGVGFESVPSVLGTGVIIRLDTTRPVKLSDTFIGDSHWSYLNFASESIAEHGGIHVKDECIHTGGRMPATGLRRKIETLLPEINGPLVLDFDGVEMATSSFLDELLGRLALTLGQNEFAKKIQIRNASEMIISIANVVIEQRLKS